MSDDRQAASDAAVTSAPPAQTPPPEKGLRVSQVLAEKFMVDPKELLRVISKQIISVGKDEPPATQEEVFHVMSVMQAYKLNPFVRQIYAFRSKGKLVISVPLDGWVAMANRNPKYQGVTYEFPKKPDGSYDLVQTSGGKPCWPWVCATCHVQGRVPTQAFAFLEEWYIHGRNAPSNWDMYPTHRLKMKAFTQAVREALGISLFDDADAEQMRLLGKTPEALAASTGRAIGTLAKTLGVALPPPTPLENMQLPPLEHEAQAELATMDKSALTDAELDELVGGDDA